MDSEKTPKLADITPVRDLRDIFNFRGISLDIILQAMAMGIIVGRALPKDHHTRYVDDYIDEVKANIMAKVGTRIPCSNHPLTQEEAKAIFLFFGTRETMALFSNCLL